MMTDTTDTSAEAERDRLEERFWSVVDRDGLTGVPSDMWAALSALVTRAAERDAAVVELQAQIDAAKALERKRDRLRDALRLTAMLFEQIMIAIDADPAETFLRVKIKPNGAEVKRISVAECLDKARAELGIEEAGHD